jgi:hypothetical protein
MRSAARPTETIPIRSWIATQTGSSVSGPVVFDQGGGSLVNATITGTVSGAQLSQATFTVAVGALTGLAACSFSGTGTQTVTANSISGTMVMTFAAPCVGPDLASPLATDTWTFSLTK